MKILLLSHTGLVSGGAEQCLLEYVDVLRNEGYKCKVLVPYKGPMTNVLTERNINHAVTGYGWATKPHRNVNAYKLRASTGNSIAHIFNEVEKYKPDVIITNTAVIPWGLYAGRAFGVPTILLVHEILNDKDPSLDILPNHVAYTEILNQNTDFVVYNSLFVQGEYAKELTRPKTSKNILYPLPALDERKINEIYKDNTISDSLKIAVFGVLAPRKNQLEIVEAAKILKNRGIHKVQIDLYGDKTANPLYTRGVRRRISEYSLKDMVKIKGFTANVYETMNEYNVIASTATYEPFGRTIIEGQLFGRIVVSNNTGGGPELVEDGVTGLIYESGNPEILADKIEWIIRNQKDALSIGSHAKSAQLKKYVTSNRYNALIEAVEYFSGTDVWSNKGNDNVFNPLLDLFSYNQQLHHRYAQIHRLIHNKITRKIKHIVKSVIKNTKTIIKNAIS